VVPVKRYTNHSWCACDRGAPGSLPGQL